MRQKHGPRILSLRLSIAFLGYDLWTLGSKINITMLTIIASSTKILLLKSVSAVAGTITANITNRLRRPRAQGIRILFTDQLSRSSHGRYQGCADYIGYGDYLGFRDTTRPNNGKSKGKDHGQSNGDWGCVRA